MAFWQPVKFKLLNPYGTKRLETYEDKTKGKTESRIIQ